MAAVTICSDLEPPKIKSLVSLIFLKRSLVFPILLFSSISLHWSLRKAFLSLLVVLWNSGFKWEYISFSPLPFTSLLFTVICKAFSGNHFSILHFFSLGIVLITASCTVPWTSASCTVPWTSARSSSDTLSDLIPWVYLSLSLYNCKGFDLGHTSGFPYFLQFMSEFYNKGVNDWDIVGSRSYFCWLYRAAPSLGAKNIIIMILVLTVWWCLYLESCVVGENVCYDQCILLVKLY